MYELPAPKIADMGVRRRYWEGDISGEYTGAERFRHHMVSVVSIFNYSSNFRLTDLNRDSMLDDNYLDLPFSL